MIYSHFYHHYSYCSLFWVSSYLSINTLVLYQLFMVTCIENFILKLKREVSRTEKRLFKDCNCVFGSSTTFQRTKEWICESTSQASKWSLTCICRIYYALKPTATTVYVWSVFYPQSAVLILHFAPSLHFTFRLQSSFYTQTTFYTWSAVCSPGGGGGSCHIWAK